ncbi:MAG: alpha/beta hydrolase [Opitutales bacterium]|nr:alpha/beta hydrolase [Opitutales bacterium]
MNLNLTQTKLCKTPTGPLEYTDSGSGEPLLALHGAMGGHDQSAILAQTIAPESFRILAVSRPGYLGTPISTGKTPEEQADCYAALLDHLGIEKVTVAAISGGGYSALYFAHRHPGRCKALILCSTTGGPMEQKPPRSFKLKTVLLRFDFLTRRMKQKVANNLESTLKRSIRFPEVRQALLKDKIAMDLYRKLTLGMFDGVRNRLEGTFNDILITQKQTYPLSELKPPTLIIHGDSDSLLPLENHGAKLALKIPNATIYVAPKGEHVTLFTHRTMIRERVADFLHTQGLC